jgi:hypothetical protein
VHYWKKDAWEMFDLTKDPNELKNIYDDTDQQETVKKLKAELQRLKTAVDDRDEFADKLPPDGVDGQTPWRRAGARAK